MGRQGDLITKIVHGVREESWHAPPALVCEFFCGLDPGVSL
jgi:hypothetical protein